MAFKPSIVTKSAGGGVRNGISEFRGEASGEAVQQSLVILSVLCVSSTISSLHREVCSGYLPMDRQS